MLCFGLSWILSNRIVEMIKMSPTEEYKTWITSGELRSDVSLKLVDSLKWNEKVKTDLLTDLKSLDREIEVPCLHEAPGMHNITIVNEMSSFIIFIKIHRNYSIKSFLCFLKISAQYSDRNWWYLKNWHQNCI